MNFPEACCRNALICSEALRDTGTIYIAASRSLHVQARCFAAALLDLRAGPPSSSGMSLWTSYLSKYNFQIMSRSSHVGRSKKNVPKVNRRRYLVLVGLLEPIRRLDRFPPGHMNIRPLTNNRVEQTGRR
jgi:hypothetical protein